MKDPSACCFQFWGELPGALPSQAMRCIHHMHLGKQQATQCSTGEARTRHHEAERQCTKQHGRDSHTHTYQTVVFTHGGMNDYSHCYRLSESPVS